MRKKSREISAFGRTLNLTTTHTFWNAADAVIVPHMGTSLDAFRALVDNNRRRVGLWGHIAPYVAAGNPLDLAIERWQLRRADHIFAYTPGGAKFAIETGAQPANITIVMNSTDTTQLVDDLADITPDEKQAFRARHSISPTAPIVAFLGGLDASKRIDFLASSLDLLYDARPDIHLIVGGTGDQAQRFSLAESRGQVTMLGRVSGREKALVLACAGALLNPGRVGLIAVESLAAGTPILTTDFAFHAPEYEYLTEGVTKFTSQNSESAFAELIVQHYREGNETAGSDHPRLDTMVENFAAGVRHLLR
jgi:glycosyltransferase involved in cell wall biosynthesis